MVLFFYMTSHVAQTIQDLLGHMTVSYTHLDVYKRQGYTLHDQKKHRYTAGTEYYEYTRQGRPVSAELVGTSLPNG